MLEYKVLRAKKALIGKLPIQDPFFDTLKQDYPGFEDWFERKSGEFAYVSFQSGTNAIEAFLYLKVEDVTEVYGDIVPTFDSKRRLKIGTFKVSRNGARLGERFLKIIFDNAIKAGVEELYVTIFDRTDDQKRLIALLEEWGFRLHGTKGEELVYTRSMMPSVNFNDPKLSYPYLSDSAGIWMVPIYPEYHTNLFPDSILNTESTIDFVEDNAVRNGINVNFVSHSWERNIKKGDMVIMYRTGGIYKGVLTTLCVAASDSLVPESFDKFKAYCGKKTVFSETELELRWNQYKTIKPFVQPLLHCYSLPIRPNLKTLIDAGVVADADSAPRGFTKLSKLNLSTILKLSKANEDLIVH